jgi:colanic acid/amylovoran biosynthesis glycosyltransferase
LKKEKAVLIHAHYGNEGVEMLPVKKGLRLPLITTFYGYDLSRLPRQEKWRAAYKDLFYHGDLFLVEGNHMRRTLIALGCPPDKIRIQHLGIDLTKFEYQEHGIKGGEKVKILFCGRFMEKKGLIYALQAVKSVAKKYHNLEFKVIGDGELRPEIESFIAQHNMGRFVTLLGYQPHQVFAQEAHSAHVLVQPSVTAKDGDSEGGAPIVLLEAQASGLPVISTLHCDIPEYVLDGRSGFLVPEGDSTALAEKLEYLIENPNLWAQMGEIGREHVEKNYNVDEQVKKLERIYHELAFQL